MSVSEEPSDANIPSPTGLDNSCFRSECTSYDRLDIVS
jgi:hypothetical protein